MGFSSLQILWWINFCLVCVFVLFCCVFSCVVVLKQQKHCSFASCEAMDVNLNFLTSGALWTWSTCPTITPSIYLVLCKIVFDAGGTTVLLEQTLGHRRYLCDTGDELYVCEIDEFWWMPCRKGVWKFGTLQCVYVLSVRLSPPCERHDIPDYYAMTLWRSVSWTTSRFTFSGSKYIIGLMDNVWKRC